MTVHLRPALVLVVSCVLATAASAQNAKTGIATSKAMLLDATRASSAAIDGWEPILTTDIRVPQQEDLTFDVALQCMLYTDTLVRSKGGNKDTSSAEASIAVRVAVEPLSGSGDVRFALPNGAGGVVYCARKQTLSATLQGIIENLSCFPENEDGVPTFDPDATGCSLLDEEIQLVLETLNANAFNFTALDLVSGDYRVTVEAKVATDASSQSGSSSARGMVGLGSMVVDEVRFVKGTDAGSGM
jgi:hypothetical protein